MSGLVEEWAAVEGVSERVKDMGMIKLRPKNRKAEVSDDKIKKNISHDKHVLSLF